MSELNSFSKYTLGAEGILEGRHHNGSTFRTSATLVSNIIAKRNEASDITEEQKQLLLQTTKLPQEIEGVGMVLENQRLTERTLGAQSFLLSAMEKKIVLALAAIINTRIEEPIAQEVISGLPARLSVMEANNKARSKAGLITIDIWDLAKLVYKGRKPNGRQVNDVFKGLLSLAGTRQLQHYHDHQKDEHHIIIEPLVVLGKTAITYRGKDKKLKNIKQDISLSDLFFFQINEQWISSPLQLLELWNDSGCSSEMFATLLFLLSQIRGPRIKEARRIEAALCKKLRAETKNLPEQERKEAWSKGQKDIKKQVKKTLVYSETWESIEKRMPQGTYIRPDNGKFNASRFRTDMESAIAGLKKVGIILDAKNIKGPNGMRTDFVLNPNWIDEQKDRLLTDGTK